MRQAFVLRFRDMEHYEAVKAAALEKAMTLNAYILKKLDDCVTVSVDETQEQKETRRRKEKKEARHRELKRDAQAAVEAEGVPVKFMERVNTPSEGHHPNCRCLRCQIKRKEI